ncbi:MAG: sigma-70 family RNA polymerase sigma factor [Candidatus Liptonbacteria bacterium]
MLDGESKIVLKAVGGEASAFGLLYDHYQPSIYRFIVLKVSRREEAEDLTHQVFLNAWQNIDKYRNLGFPFSSWLYHIARNLVIDHYRTRREHINVEDVENELVSELAQLPDATTELKMEMEKARRAITRLKPIHQDVLIMRFVEELSIKEVADAIKKSEGAVKLLQHRAMEQLKKLMK